MRPQRPYLLRAFFDWILDSSLTPYVVVNANYFGVKIPEDYVKDGQIVLNIAPSAVGNFQMTHEEIHFNARFGGTNRKVYIPMGAIQAIYAKENGSGTLFQAEACYDIVPASLTEIETILEDDKKAVDKKSEKGRPKLRVVK